MMKTENLTVGTSIGYARCQRNEVLGESEGLSAEAVEGIQFLFPLCDNMGTLVILCSCPNSTLLTISYIFTWQVVFVICLLTMQAFFLPLYKKS